MTVSGVVWGVNDGVKKVLEGGCCDSVEDVTELGGKNCFSYVACYSPYVIVFSLYASVIFKWDIALSCKLKKEEEQICSDLLWLCMCAIVWVFNSFKKKNIKRAVCFYMPSGIYRQAISCTHPLCARFSLPKSA